MKRCLMAAFALVAGAVGAGPALAQGVIPDSAWGGWGGPYAGLELGGQFANSEWKGTGTNDMFPGAVAPDGTALAHLNGSGLRGGVFLGYNWQFGKLVVGPDLDFALADSSRRIAGLPGCGTVTSCNGGSGPLPTDPLADDWVKVNPTWDANFRARLGYLITPDLLAFATGGVALQEVEISGGCRTALWDPLCAGPPFGNNKTKSQTNTSLLLGWTAGAGLEARLDQHWHLRGEYRYAGFSPTSGSLWSGQPAGLEGWDAYHYRVKLETHIATAGLSYQF